MRSFRPWALTAILCAVATNSKAQQTKRPFQLAEWYRLSVLSAPTQSPEWQSHRLPGADGERKGQQVSSRERERLAGLHEAAKHFRDAPRLRDASASCMGRLGVEDLGD